MARVGGAQVFFDVLASFNASRLVADQKTAMTIMQATMLDALNTIGGEFAALGGMVDDFIGKIDEVTLAFEEARIDFEKFVNLGEEATEALSVMGDEVVRVGMDFGFTGTEALEAAARIAQMGTVIGEANIVTGMELAAAFGLMSGMESEQASRRLTQLAQQTDFMVQTSKDFTKAQYDALSPLEQQNRIHGNTIQVLNQLNTIENRSIATLDQMTYSMNQFASQAALTGDSVANMGAYSAALLESGEQQGAAGRALRMMFARLGGDIAGAREEMEAMGVEVIDSEGNMKTLMDIMTDLNEQGWKQSSGQIKQNIAQTIAGNRHYVRFIKLMENYDRVVDLSTMANQELDGAMDEVNRRLETTAVQLEIARNRSEELSVEMGQALLPAMLEAQELTNAFNESLAKYVRGDYGQAFADLSQSIITMQQVGTIVAPFAQIQLILRGIVVGLGAYRSMMAGIKGDIIANLRLHHKQQEFMTTQNITDKQHHQNIQNIVTLKSRLNQLTEQETINEYNITENVRKREAIYTQLINESYKGLNAATQKQLVADKQHEASLHIISGLQKSIEGSVKRRLVPELNLLEVKSVSGQLDAKTVNLIRTELAIGKDMAANLTTRMGQAKVKAALAEADLQRQAQNLTMNVESLSLEQQQKMVVEGRLKMTTKESQEAMKKYNTENGVLKILDKQRYHRIGNMMHLETLLIMDGYHKRILDAKTDVQKEMNILFNAEKMTAEQILALEQQLLRLDIQLTEEEREGLMLAEKREQTQVEVNARVKEAIVLAEKLNKKAEESTKHFSSMSISLGTASAATNILAMVMPMLGNDSDNMRRSMAAMNASLVLMVPSMASMARSALVTSGAVMGMSGSLALITGIAGGLALFAYFDHSMKAAEETANQVAKVHAEMASLQQTMKSMETREGALISNEFLQARLGIGDITIDELATNADEAERIYKKLVDAEKNMFDEMSSVEVEYAKQALKEVEMIYSAHLEAKGMMGISAERQVEMIAKTFNKVARSQGLFDSIWESTVGAYEELGFGDYYSNLTDELGLAATAHVGDLRDAVIAYRLAGKDFTEEQYNALSDILDNKALVDMVRNLNQSIFNSEQSASDFLLSLQSVSTVVDDTGEGINVLADDVKNLTEEIYNFSGAREELFFGGKYGNVTGSLYRQVVQQGVGTLYHKNEVIMSNNFHGFFNEEEAATRIIDILNDYFAER